MTTITNNVLAKSAIHSNNIKNVCAPDDQLPEQLDPQIYYAELPSIIESEPIGTYIPSYEELNVAYMKWRGNRESKNVIDCTSPVVHWLSRFYGINLCNP